MNTYQFILTPIEKFFFGKEQHPFYKPYFVESNLFPQQTGLLGLIRHAILINKGIIEKHNEWDDKIGIKSFDGSIGQTFGIINLVYPLTIYDTISKKHYLPYTRLNGLTEDFTKSVLVNYGNLSTTLNLFTRTKDSKEVKDYYDAKNQKTFKTVLVDSDDYSNLLDLVQEYTLDATTNSFGIKHIKKSSNDAVFVKSEQPGIRKNYQGQSKDDAYYRIQYFSMNSPYSYSVQVETTEELIETTIFITHGAEAKVFRLDIVSGANAKLYNHNKPTQGNYFQLISDTLIEKEVLDNADFVLGNTRLFRNLNTNAKDKHKLYNHDFKDKHASLLLVEKGSILKVDTDKIDFIKKTIEGKTAFRKIGYNFYKQIDKLK